MLVASALFMAAVQDFENVVTAVSDGLLRGLFFLGRRPLLRSHDTNIIYTIMILAIFGVS